MTVYQVVGGRAYHSLRPGEVFEASLDAAAEKRAILRGSIVVIDDRPPGLSPGSYQPPDGWEPTSTHREAPSEAPLSLKGA